MVTRDGSADLLVAGVLESIQSVTDFSEACSLVLDRVVTQGDYDRAVVVARARGEIRGVGWGIEDAAVDRLIADAGDPDAPISVLLRRRTPDLITHAGAAFFPEFMAFLVIPFVRGDGDAAGLLLLEADLMGEEADRVRSVFERIGPALIRTLQLEILNQHVERADRQRDQLMGILNALPDPALLTDDQNNILLSNDRAEWLLLSSDDDSEGRRQAVQVNNLLFSSFLTQSVIGHAPSVSRELNLVDPSDGSDLLFEALSKPVPSSVAAEGGVMTILRDITDLKRALSELESQFKRSRLAEHRSRRERDQLNVVLENVGDPILVTDNQAKIILMNREAERLFEAPATDDPGPTSRTVVRANDTKFTGLISNFLLQDAVRHVEALDLTDPDAGTIMPIEVVSCKILDNHGEPAAIVSVLHDLTQVVENERLARELQALNEGLEERIVRATQELEAHNQRLEWQSRELEKASRLKSEFLANMSHELRTPLNVLIGYASLLRDGLYGPLNDDQINAIDKVRTSSRHLLDLINDILDLSKIEAGKMPLTVEELQLSTVVGEVAEAAEQLIGEKPIELSIDLASDLPVVLSDRTKVKQILLNLVSNAIKFTDSGTVTVTATHEPDAEAVRIAIADTGVGIQDEDLPSIFEDFRQLDQSHTKMHAGTGLGLSITKKLVTLLGGHISVASEYRIGTTFTVELPTITDPNVDDPDRRALLDALARVERMSLARDG